MRNRLDVGSRAMDDAPEGGNGGPSSCTYLDDLIPEIVRVALAPFGRPEEAADHCRRLRSRLSDPVSDRELERLRELSRLLRTRVGPAPRALFEFLEEIAAGAREPWPILRDLLLAADLGSSRRALSLARNAAGRGALAGAPDLFETLAERFETAPAWGDDPALLEDADRTLREATRLSPAGHEENLASRLVSSQIPAVRRFAARLLDREGEPPNAELTARLLGGEAGRDLAELLAYTRAGHLDLLALVPEPGTTPPVLAALRRAESVCGTRLLGDVIASLGWPAVNLGVEVEAAERVSVDGAFPYVIPEKEAALFRNVPGAKTVERRVLIIAHGGEHRPERRGEEHRDRVARFRALNLAHAAILPDFIDLAPLTSEKARRLVQMMDGIVNEFTDLFRGETEEAAILPSVYRELKESILALLAAPAGGPELSTPLARKVQAFEDPATLGEVGSLHGLKRYLHQRGLRLGFRLVEGPRGTNRTVALAVTTPDRLLRVARAVDYADFEPEEGAAGIPPPVAVLAATFGRQLLQGLEKVPAARVFCYGHEAHYYFAFGTHPAFLRIDFSPPLRGGMIDLEYYGVSKNELGYHPAPDLPALKEAFRALDFDVQVDGTRVLARFDKERAVGLEELHAKVEDLLSLVPYWMDLDWVLGSLALDSDAKPRVATAWARFLERWGCLPLDDILTADRTGVVVSRKQTPAGERESVWQGEPPYRDRFHPSPTLAALSPLRDALAAVSPELVSGWGQGAEPEVGQVLLDRALLAPLREAAAAGEVVETGSGYAPAPPSLVVRDHEAAFFARLLAGGGESLAAAAAVASLFPSLEKTVRFLPSGSVNDHVVERGALRLAGVDLGLFALRDPSGVARLACFGEGRILRRSRSSQDVPWTASASTDSSTLAALLRRGNVLDAGPLPPPPAESVTDILAIFSAPNPTPRPPVLTGEAVMDGLRVSPGHAVGPVRFEEAPESSPDAEGGILVAPALAPADLPALEAAAGVVSTGGSALSHLGLAAQSLGKPSLIVPGSWRRDPTGKRTVAVRTSEYREETERVEGFLVAVRRHERSVEHFLAEGDLLEVDGDSGRLRLLGSSREAKILHEGFRTLRRTAEELGRRPDPRALLALRGRRLKASRQIELVLERLDDVPLIRYAAEEILLGALEGATEDRELKSRLLGRLLTGTGAGPVARVILGESWAALVRRHEALRARGERRVPVASDPYEILAVRLAFIHSGERLDMAGPLLRERGLLGDAKRMSGGFDDEGVRSRLGTLREERGQAALDAARGGASPAILRPLLTQVRRLDLVLGTPEAGRAPWLRESERLRVREESTVRALGTRLVLRGEEACSSLHPLIGQKAANLAVVEAMLGTGRVPPWFAVTHRALADALHSSSHPGAGSRPLREEILDVLSRNDLSPREQSRRIAALWDAVAVPGDLSREAAGAYRALAADRGGYDPPVVAVRSSAREEDLESRPRAGEFETFLFIRGEKALLEHLRRAWAGLWTERALHRRRREGTTSVLPGGGVLIQRLVFSRVSGVLHTANVAEGEPGEMLINAGLGMGEGVVSGAVPVDHLRVVKPADPDAPLRFRAFVADKRERIVADARSGRGTVRTEVPYHQRLRPALEYAEMAELVRLALRLEAGFGCPLDLEFALEDERLWILQARPLGVYRAALRETAVRFPLPGVSPLFESGFESEVEP